mgnify:CR=1 FL=1
MLVNVPSTASEPDQPAPSFGALPKPPPVKLPVAAAWSSLKFALNVNTVAEPYAAFAFAWIVQSLAEYEPVPVAVKIC